MRYNITPETQVYARVESVARSGMSRTISFYMIEGARTLLTPTPRLSQHKIGNYHEETNFSRKFGSTRTNRLCTHTANAFRRSTTVSDGLA